MANNLELELDIRLCLELLEEYNKRDLDHFDISRCKNALKKSSHEEVKKYLEDIKDLIHKQDQRIALDILIKETKEYGMEWVKNKYGLNNKEKKKNEIKTLG